MTDMLLFVELIIVSILAVWMAVLAVHWKRKYTELHKAQERYQRAKKPWPPIQS